MTDNKKAAAEAAQRLCREMGERGQIAVFAHEESSGTSRERVDGFRMEVREKYPQAEIVNVSYETEEGIPVKETLEQYPDLKGIFCTSGTVTREVLEQLEKAGREDLLVAGFDADAELIEAMREGRLWGTICQNPRGMGYAAVTAALRASAGMPVDPSIDTGYVWLDQKNYWEKRIRSIGMTADGREGGRPRNIRAPWEFPDVRGLCCCRACAVLRGGLLFLINFRDFSGKLKLYIRKGIFRKIPGIGTGLRLLRRRGRHRRFFEIRSVFPGPGRGRRRFLRPSGSCFLRLFCFRFTSFPAPVFSFRLFFFPFLLLPGLAGAWPAPDFPAADSDLPAPSNLCSSMASAEPECPERPESLSAEW